ncbi:MAG TPA: hypothetical protein VFE33_05240 [Thermoanaerobaculia bacterium]|nr:hypothetical protein [Thermoanaerobaculia bacterium]
MRKRLLPEEALALARVAHAIGDLLTIQARLASLSTASDLGLAEILETARRASVELAPVRERLAKLAAELPAPPTDLSDAELSPLELTRASLECVLADHLDPAIATLAALLFPEEARGPADDGSPVH